MRLALLCLLLSSCGPVLLGEEARDEGGEAGSPPPNDAATPWPHEPTDDAPVLRLDVAIAPLDCGRCFELRPQASGGQPPYEYEWEDGSARGTRTECVEGSPVSVVVVARDAAFARSAPQTLHLQRSADAGCTTPLEPTMPSPQPTARLCLLNLSFEGTPAANFGEEQEFDADPWSTCTNAMTTNTPDIGNASVAQTLGRIPEPTNGVTFLALGEGEQVSQTFCDAFPEDEPIYIQADLARLNIGAGIVPETEQVFLEVWSGLSVDCSLRELLWASPALAPGWTTHCMTLRPRSFMTQLTLRANSDMSLPTPAYLIVDNLRQVERCL